MLQEWFDGCDALADREAGVTLAGMVLAFFDRDRGYGTGLGNCAIRKVDCLGIRNAGHEHTKAERVSMRDLPLEPNMCLAMCYLIWLIAGTDGKDSGTFLPLSYRDHVCLIFTWLS